MIQKALEYLVGLGKANTILVDGREFSDKRLYGIEPEKFPTLETTSLKSIVTYIKKIKNEVVQYDDTQTIIRIESPTKVQIDGVVHDNWNKRDTYMSVNAKVPAFSFGNFYNAEEFNIAMQSKFLSTDDKDIILMVVGNLRDEAVLNQSDDGVSQTTTIRTGVATVANVKVPNPVSLRPYRTFLEVEQPASRFVFRMKDGGRCALFEADGGAWELEAKKNIYNYLEYELAEEISDGWIVLMM